MKEERSTKSETRNQPKQSPFQKATWHRNQTRTAELDMNNRKYGYTLWRRILLCLLLLPAIQHLRADFSGDYAPSRWTLNAHGGNGEDESYFEDGVLYLDSGTTGTGTLAIMDATIRVTESGNLSFDWNFLGWEGNSYTFAWLSNGVARVLASDSEEELTGSASFTVKANDVIGFRVTAPKGGDRENGEYSSLEISNFVGPGQVGQPPTITVQPTDKEGCIGSEVEFDVDANNASFYQWQFNGQNIEDETDSVLYITDVSPANVGHYRVIVSNSYGSITSAEVSLTLGTPPAITSQPTSQSACVGQNITLCVGATSPRMLSYQWYLNDEELEGATDACLNLPDIRRSNAGRYSVIVSDDCAELTSEDAIVSVSTPPEIEGQPRSQRRIVGEMAEFAVVHSGTAPFSYQWFRNGQPVSGADQPNLAIAVGGGGDAGEYTVAISNGCGTRTSQTALLVVEAESLRLGISLQSSNSVNLWPIGPAGRQYVLEISTNLFPGISEWMPVTTNNYCSEQLVWRQTVNEGGAVYRARILSELPKVPVSPGNLSAASSPNGTAVSLAWQDSSIDETGFIIERSSNGSEFVVIATVGTGVAAYVDASVSPDDCYYYRVRARNCAGESLPSNEAFVCTAAAISAPGPLRLSETSLGNVRVQWSDNSTNETGFEIERSVDGVMFNLLQVAPPNSDSAARIVDRAVVVGPTYHYRARALVGQLNSRYSSVSRISLRPVAPVGLSGCGAANVSRWATFNWAAAAGASGYVIEIAADAPDAANVVERRTATVTGPTHSIPDNDPLSASRQIYWRVRGQNSGGLGPWSAWCGFTTEAAVAPTGLSPRNQTGVSRTPTFTWNPARGAQSYNFRIAADAPSEANVVERRSNNTTSATLAIPANDPLSPARRFYWQVQTVDRTETGPWSSWAQFETINDLPAQVTGLAGCAAVNVSRWATFNWAAAAGASGYVIEIAADAPDAANVVERRTAMVTGTTHTIPDNDPLSASRQVYWRVRGTNDNGAGPWSAWCGFTTEAAVAPTGLIPRNQTGVSRTPTFTWNVARGALSYNFRIAADAPSEANVVERRSTNTTGAAYTIPGNDPLSPSRTFYWQVQTVDRTETGPWSSWAQFETINDLPAQVTGLAGCGAVNVSRWATLSWAAAAGAPSYVIEIAADAPDAGNVVGRRTATVTGTTHSIPDNDPLSASRQIYWRVRGKTPMALGLGVRGVASSPRRRWRRQDSARGINPTSAEHRLLHGILRAAR